QRLQNLDPTKGAVLAAAHDQILKIAAASPEAAQQVQLLVGSFVAGDITAEQFRIVLNATTESQLRTAAAAQVQSQSTLSAAEAARQHQVALEQSASASQLDAANKAADTAQTQLLAARTQAAVDAFIALNPNMQASQAAAAAGAAGLPPFIAKMIE